MKAQNKTMKTISTSNWRPLRRALCTLLVGITALWAMPRNARAQIYVIQYGNGSVGEYDATTGAAINANFITGLSGPAELAVASVPEPSLLGSLALGSTAFIGMCILRSRRSLRSKFPILRGPPGDRSA
jgi:hypothetical protein